MCVLLINVSCIEGLALMMICRLLTPQTLKGQCIMAAQTL